MYFCFQTLSIININLHQMLKGNNRKALWLSLIFFTPVNVQSLSMASPCVELHRGTWSLPVFYFFPSKANLEASSISGLPHKPKCSAFKNWHNDAALLWSLSRRHWERARQSFEEILKISRDLTPVSLF